MVFVLAGSAAWADMWCAAPLEVHEWGVHEVHPDGSPLAPTPLPSWFHRAGEPGVAHTPVWQLPADSGIRRLPVVQVFGGAAPFALEVGFTDGAASSWWPAVDRVLPAAVASSPGARAAKDQLLAARAARSPMGPNPPIGPDPTKQLGWDALALTTAGEASSPAELPWVAALRAVPGALWVNRGSEADRFLYYEADTSSAPDGRLERTSAGWVVHDDGPWPLHDLVVIADGQVWTADQVAPGGSAPVRLGPLDPAAVAGWLRGRWVGPLPVPNLAQDCVTMRDPAIPVEAATGYRLTGPEVDVLLSVWSAALLAPGGTRLVYREDPAALDARMPLAAYTDAFHYVELDRLGLVLVAP